MDEEAEQRLTLEIARTEERILEAFQVWQHNHSTVDHMGKTPDEVQGAWDNQTKMQKQMGANSTKLDLIVDEFFGEAVTDIDGEVHRSGGTRDEVKRTREAVEAMSADVAMFRTKSENGGIPARLSLTPNQKVALWTVVITAAASIGVATIALLQAIMEGA
jgi:hypothetical protein